MNVSQLNLQEKGFYRELIDECFIQNSYQIKINCKTFTRIHQLNVRSFARLLAKLHESLLIVCPNFDQSLEEVEVLIPSVSNRLCIIDRSSNGGKAKAEKSEKNSAKYKYKEKENIKEDVFNFKDELIAFGFEDNLVDEWLKVRRNKKLTNTETAFKKFIKQVGLCPLDKNLILEKCVEKSWGGFEAEWMKKETSKNKYTPEQLKEAKFRCHDLGEPFPAWFNQEDKHLIGL